MHRRLFGLLLCSLLLALGAWRATPVSQQARLIVQNGTYSSLIISLAEGSGEERQLGQAPPDFANTLVIPAPLPDGPVHFVARLRGEQEVLYRSDPVRLTPGSVLRWLLPANTIGRGGRDG